MTDWSYGDAGDRFKVVPGSRWQVGPHQVVCNDLEDNPQPFGASFQPDMTYTDPPWNQGNAKSFRTKNGQKDRAVDFPTFLRALLTAVKTTRGDVFIEMGKAETPNLTTLVNEAGGRVLQQWGITYYRKHPCVLLRTQFGAGLRVPPMPDVSGMDDDHTPAAAIACSTVEGNIVFDPCTGRGLTAVTSDKLGRVFRGSELNPRRLAVTIDKLVKCGHAAERIQ